MFDTVRRVVFGALLAACLITVSVFGQTGLPPSDLKAGAQADVVRRLSVDEAVRLALEQNLSLQVQRLNPQIQDLNTDQVRTAWTPTISSTISDNSSTNPVSSFLSGASSQLVTKNLGVTVQENQFLPWGGGNYNVTWANGRGESNSVFSSPNPSLSSTLNATFNQPLLRNFRIDNTRQQLLISKKNREMSDVQLRQTVLVTIRAVKSAYWDLAFAVDNLKVQQQSLDIARESLRDNKARVAVGTMAPIDIIEAEAEVARNEESVIVAQAQITRAEDALRQLVFDPKVPDFWAMKFELTDAPVFRAQDVDGDAAVRAALEKRTDIVNMRKTLEAADISIRYFKNQTLPDLNVQAGYGLSGQGGTDFNFSDTFPPVPTSVVKNGYGSVLSQMFSNDFHNWSLAVTVGYPIGRSNAQAALAKAKVSYSQSELQLRSLELSVSTQVREAVRTLNTNRKRVDATRVSRELAERKLVAEQKKFEAGMSTNFLVIQAQRDLATARNSELQAVLDYNRSLVDFETVQEAPISGGGVTLASSGQ
jgi:outer membrane protein TolC